MGNGIGKDILPKLMSIKKTSEYLGVTDYFLRQGIKNGTIPFTRSGCKYYIIVDALIERLKNNS